jgi:hypothetical protein
MPYPKREDNKTVMHFICKDWMHACKIQGCIYDSELIRYATKL